MLRGRVIENAKGDGNCAFNSFVIAFSQPSVLEALEKEARERGESLDELFKEFIEACAYRLGMSNNWIAVKSVITTLREQDKEALQEILAPIMRHLSINCARIDEDHIERTKEPLLSAFTDFVFSQLGIVVCGLNDDVYRRHPFIRTKFAELSQLIRSNQTILTKLDITHYNQLRKDELAIAVTPLSRRTARETRQLEQIQKELGKMDGILDSILTTYHQELNKWWMESGYETFLYKLCDDGEWAGDLELFQLSRYFHLNVDVQRQNFIYNIGISARCSTKITLSNEYGLHYNSIANEHRIPKTAKPRAAKTEALAPISAAGISSTSSVITTTTSTFATSSKKENVTVPVHGIDQYEAAIIRAFKAGAYENEQKWKTWLSTQGASIDANIPKEVRADAKFARDAQTVEVVNFFKHEKKRIKAQTIQEKEDRLLAQSLHEEERKRWGLRR